MAVFSGGAQPKLDARFDSVLVDIDPEFWIQSIEAKFATFLRNWKDHVPVSCVFGIEKVRSPRCPGEVVVFGQVLDNMLGFEC